MRILLTASGLARRTGDYRTDRETAKRRSGTQKSHLAQSEVARTERLSALVSAAAAAATTTAACRRGVLVVPRAERGPAAAACDRVGVVDLEAAAHKRVDVVDIRAADILGAHRVDPDRKAARLEFRIAGMGFVIEGHAILQ